MQNAYALVIGIANYQDSNIKKLPPTVRKDAKDIYHLLTDPHHCGYLPENVALLLDEQATKAAILEALNQLSQHSHPESTVFFYLSSHGGRVEEGTDAGEYLLPVDVKSGEQMASSAISSAEFTEALRKISAHKLVVIFDCCHSGGIGQPKEAKTPIFKGGLPEEYYDRLKKGRGRVILASSRSDEKSLVFPDADNSVFTQHLLAGFKDATIGADGVIRILDLFNYLQPKVTKDSPKQHPILKADIEDNFPIALYLGGSKSTRTISPPAPMDLGNGKLDNEKTNSEMATINSVKLDKPQILALKLLGDLLPAQFEDVLGYYEVPDKYISKNQPQATQANELVKYARQKEGDQLTQLLEVINQIRAF